MKVDRRMLGDGNRKGIWEKMTNAEKEREYSKKYNCQVDLPLIWWLYSFLGGWETFSGNQLNFKGCFRAVESDFMESYQAMIIRSVILPFKQIVTLDGWVVVLTPFMVLCNHLLTSHYLWLWFYRIPLLGSGIACVGQRFPVEERRQHTHPLPGLLWFQDDLSFFYFTFISKWLSFFFFLL